MNKHIRLKEEKKFKNFVLKVEQWIRKANFERLQNERKEDSQTK